ncbi:hypothetical protein CMI37_04490 [Candidatus Pacearchaeota archaeon]|nr:hypothetical protein [Candidatus Pacearchaeota archaeon]
MPRKMVVQQDGEALVVNGVEITINGVEAGDQFDEKMANSWNNRLIHTAIAIAKRRKEGAEGGSRAKYDLA